MKPFNLLLSFATSQILFFANMTVCAQDSTAAASLPKPSPCSATEARQFDFWLGEWNVTAGDKLAGTNKISRASGGCALLEEYEGRSGYQGKSLNFFNPTIGKWQQIWVGSAGDILMLTGEYREGKMILEGESTQAGKKVKDRITWHNNTIEQTVRQVWEKSTDGGAAWEIVFDGMYAKKPEEH